jgi:hypothetical protein
MDRHRWGIKFGRRTPPADVSIAFRDLASILSPGIARGLTHGSRVQILFAP